MVVVEKKRGGGLSRLKWGSLQEQAIAPFVSLVTVTILSMTQQPSTLDLLQADT